MSLMWRGFGPPFVTLRAVLNPEAGVDTEISSGARACKSVGKHSALLGLCASKASRHVGHLLKKSPHTQARPPGPPANPISHQLSALQLRNGTVWPSPPSSMPMTVPTPPGMS